VLEEFVLRRDRLDYSNKPEEYELLAKAYFQVQQMRMLTFHAVGYGRGSCEIVVGEVCQFT